MKRISLGFWVGLVLALLHGCLVLLAYSSRRESAFAMMPFLLFDGPVLFLPRSLLEPMGDIGTLIQFGVLGSAQWFAVPWILDRTLRLCKVETCWLRAVALVIALPIVLFGRLDSRQQSDPLRVFSAVVRELQIA